MRTISTDLHFEITGFLSACRVFDAPAAELDTFVRMAAAIARAPFALLSFWDEGRLRICSQHGFCPLLRQPPSFCASPATGNALVTEVAQEDEVVESVLQEYGIRFYAGIPIVTAGGVPVGSLYVMDTVSQSLDCRQRAAMDDLSKGVSTYLEMRRKNLGLEDSLSKAQKFQSLFNNSNEIHCITNAEGTIEFINDSVQQLLGYTPQEVVGKNIWDFAVAGERERVMPDIYDAIQQGQEQFQIETRVITRDGRKRWLSWSDVIREGYWLVNGRDVTERREIELQLKILSLAVDKSSVGVLIRNEHHEVLWMNNALERILGYSLKDLRGKVFGTMLAGKDTDMVLLASARMALEEGKPYEIEILLYKQDGTPVWLYLTNDPLYNQSNQLERQVCIVVDITERKKAELELIKTRDEALRLGNAKESFLSVMSHEMRTPLNAVIGITRALVEENPMDYQKENLDILKFSAENMLTLINDILDFTKIETGSLQLESTPFEIRKLVNNTVESLKFKTDEKGIRICASIDPQIPEFLKGDPTRLYQIFINLLGNAVKFTEEGEVRLDVSLAEAGQDAVRVRFSVSDTGIGIDPDKIGLIFEPYTQAGSDITRKFGGTGLGLTITSKLVDLHHSRIFVESEPGKGTCFYFTASFAVAEAVPEPVDETGEAETSIPARILLVDDNAMNRLLAKKVLDKWDMETDFAVNGAEALEKIQANEYDLVFMDIHMPVMDGLEAVKRIRGMNGQKYRHLPVIALTASAMNGEEKEFLEAGMNDYVLKPFEPHELLRKMRSYLVRRN